MALDNVLDQSPEFKIHGNDCISTANGSNAWKETQHQTLWPRPLVKTWTVMLFLSTSLLYCSRMTLPICAVTMATQFQWSKTDSGMALASFFWGYCFTQILGGHASDRIGGESVLLLSTTVWAIITAVTPFLAKFDWNPLASMMIARFLMGLSQGVHYPSLASLCSQRVVEGKKGFLMSTMGSGSYLGTMMVGSLGSLMLEHYGWESVFYGTGLLAGLWSLVVWRYLLKGEVISVLRLSNHATSSSSFSNLRWLRLLKQPSVCAMVTTHMCYCSASYTLISWLPTYFKDTFPHAKGWVYNVIPWFVAIPSAQFGGWLSDCLIMQGYGTAAVRKMMQFLSMGVSSVFILFLCIPVKCPSAVTLISVTMGLATFNSSGVVVNVQDLAPSCAGALFGFMNMCGAFTGLILVYLSGYLIEVTTSWVPVFSIITLVNVVGIAVFLMFGDAQRVDLEETRRITHI
ncbi:solute carrier family 17 member 9-like isoform X1 [Hypomesus transpacificus]|uniref:solute carrier family 17 member 9-like isoform X1 n=1 Tax=Hypomesus transpacificus TaxID=137520 RepID=UPI001F0812DC|nr:solute carrier family 17 member 9-like isoform X1 [Hypomesus transpacificus]